MAMMALEGCGGSAKAVRVFGDTLAVEVQVQLFAVRFPSRLSVLFSVLPSDDGTLVLSGVVIFVASGQSIALSY
eukprot:scaffold13885_cov476-Alexandrium_tamarense.AAC.1